jgi:hypothetical protein
MSNPENNPQLGSRLFRAMRRVAGGLALNSSSRSPVAPPSREDMPVQHWAITACEQAFKRAIDLELTVDSPSQRFLLSDRTSQYQEYVQLVAGSRMVYLGRAVVEDTGYTESAIYPYQLWEEVTGYDAHTGTEQAFARERRIDLSGMIVAVEYDYEGHEIIYNLPSEEATPYYTMLARMQLSPMSPPSYNIENE